MSRLLKIARREYLAYIRTLGFWLSMLLMPLGLFVAAGAPMLLERSAPIPTLAVIDLSGQRFAETIAPRLQEPGPTGKPQAVIVPSPVRIENPQAASATLRPWLLGERLLPDGRKLNAVAIIHGQGEATAIDFWSASVIDRSLEQAVAGIVGRAMRGERLKAAGMAPEQIRALDSLAPKVTAYSPKAAAGEVSLRDRLPGIVGFVLGMLLWSVIFTGAGILLNSIIEEKSSRILEVLLSSASAPEIMFGKILGAAGVTATVLAVWAALGGSALVAANPEIARDVAAVLLGKGLIFYFALYLVGGYLMYASLFIAVGAFCETTREAQTMLGPVMIVLTIPIIFMAQAITRPDAPILEALSWVPPFTPFIMATRAAGEPPLWQIVGTGLLMAATTAVVIWIAGKAFRTGALSTQRLSFAGLFARLRRAG
jgi:ABC-2 type transport system permease protein